MHLKIQCKIILVRHVDIADTSCTNDQQIEIDQETCKEVEVKCQLVLCEHVCGYGMCRKK